MHSEFWLPKYVFTTEWDETSDRYLLLLNSIRRSVAGFVQIVTGESIPVIFSSGDQSYTDGKSVVISATKDFSELDSMVGLALHEGSHILLSKPLFMMGDIINWLQSSNTDTPLTGYEIISAVDAINNFNRRLFVQVLLDDLGVLVKKRDLKSRMVREPSYDPNIRRDPNFHNIWMDVHHIVNVLEDRRIDSWMYQNIGGYRPYYDSLYERYWHNDEITNAMKDGYVEDKNGVVFRLDEPTFRNYKFWITNMTNPEFDTSKAPPGMDEIVALADLDNIRRLDMSDLEISNMDRLMKSILQGGNYSRTDQILCQMPDIYSVALEIMKIVYSHVEDVPDSSPEENPENKFGNGTPRKMPGTEELPNYDIHNSQKEVEGIEDQSEAEDAFEALDIQSKMVDGQMSKEDMDGDKARQMKNLDEANAESREATWNGGKVPMTIYKKLTPSIVADPHFPFKGNSSNAFAKGVRMGRLLAHKLRVIQDESVVLYPRQKRGRLDKRMVAGIGVGDYNIFNTTKVEKHDPVMVDLSIDASTSMKHNNRWENAYSMAVSLAMAASITRKMRVRINIRGYDKVAIIYDSKTDNMNSFRSISSKLGAYGSTPEGLAFECILKEILEDVKDTRRFFVNLSDGCPEMWTPNGSYNGPPAYHHTRSQVRLIEKAGIQVMSYLIDGNEWSVDNFREMYGPAATVIDTDNIGQIAKTLNKMFLKGGV